MKIVTTSALVILFSTVGAFLWYTTFVVLTSSALSTFDKVISGCILLCVSAAITVAVIGFVQAKSFREIADSFLNFIVSIGHF